MDVYKYIEIIHAFMCAYTYIRWLSCMRRPRSNGTTIVMSTLGTQILFCMYYSMQKGTRLFVKMLDSKSEEGKVQDEPGSSYARK